VKIHCPMCLVGGDVDIVDCDYDRESFSCTIKCKQEREQNGQNDSLANSFCSCIHFVR
jgi:hypothetical protein